MRRTTLGRSVQDRPIEALKLDGPAPAILFFGAIHGDEPLGPPLLERLCAEIAAPLPRETWIVPTLNPDGLARLQQNNANGVDLNRNFPASNWSPTARQPKNHPGSAPASEPETRLLCDLVARIGARRLIALHSPFRCVNYDGPARALAERMSARCGYPATADIGYPTPGSAGSYFGNDLGLEVITLEIPNIPAEEAWSQVRGALHAALDP
jgi:protein MpaA